MMLRHVLLTALSCVVLVGAAGNSNGGMNGGSDGGMNGGSDTSMKVTGTIQSIDSTDSMFVVQSDTGTDTLYFDKDTKMNAVRNKFKEGEQVTAHYKMQDDKKMATKVMPMRKGKGKKGGATNGNGSDTSMTPPDTGMGGGSDTTGTGGAGGGTGGSDTGTGGGTGGQEY